MVLLHTYVIPILSNLIAFLFQLLGRGSIFPPAFSIHAFLNHGNKMKYITIAFILMSRRQKKDYIAVFRHLRSFLPEPLRLKNYNWKINEKLKLVEL